MLGRRTRSLGEGALRTQLSVAQQRIATLEGYIHNREREYHQVNTTQLVSVISCTPPALFANTLGIINHYRVLYHVFMLMDRLVLPVAVGLLVALSLSRGVLGGGEWEELIMLSCQPGVSNPLKKNLMMVSIAI